MDWILHIPATLLKLTTSPLLQGCGVAALALLVAYLVTNIFRGKRWVKLDH